MPVSLLLLLLQAQLLAARPRPYVSQANGQTGLCLLSTAAAAAASSRHPEVCVLELLPALAWRCCCRLQHLCCWLLLLLLVLMMPDHPQQ